MSTDSGIPDYRGPEGTLRRRAPMQYREFVHDPAARRRYWARSAIGWPRMAAVRPNAAHHAVARLEAAGRLAGVLTQNVDRLHQAAGSRTVLELHGSLAEALCLSCGRRESRGAVQQRFLAANPGWPPASAASDPDGDAELSEHAAESFVVPACAHCGGILKPDVVFFGESVPRPRVDTAWSMLAGAEALLVLGSSLAVFSGFRFVDRAARDGKPVAIVNQGATRGDELATMKVDGRLADVLPRIVEALGLV